MKRAAMRALSLLLPLALAAGLRAQHPGTPDAPLTTLRLSATLAQVPTLVLSERFQPMAPIPTELFTVSIDDGKPFTPTRVRREGDDPLSLAVLLDLSGAEQALVENFPGLVEAWAKASLLPHDRVSLYAFDCATIRTVYAVSAAETPVLRHGVDAALRSTSVHGGKDQPACATRKHLWDALSIVTAQLASAPGRRIVLAVTDGKDWGSRFRLKEVRFRAAAEAVAIFGLSEPHRTLNASAPLPPAKREALDLLCSMTGGVTLPGVSRFEDVDLRDFIRLVRDRYVIEFPRPKGMEGPQHTIAVVVRKERVVVRPAGLSMVAETVEEKADGLQASEPAPEAGTHRILPSPQ